MIYDKEFLLNLDRCKHKVIYARITTLTFQETPIEQIEGRVTQGSINLDGASAVRRTCSLTLVAEDYNYNNFYWGLNTKFKLEIGVQNTIDKRYPDIIWFKQGIYLITSLNTSHSTSSFTISLQGKDKMCLLNGDVGGTLESSIDFGTIEEEDNNGNWVIRSLPIEDIIRNAVHVYAQEPYHNIIIKDLDTYGLELLEYRYDASLYLCRQVEPAESYSNTYREAFLNGKKPCWCNGKLITLDDLEIEDLEILTTSLTGNTHTPSLVSFAENAVEKYYVAKIETGQAAGYRLTDLTYPDDLIAKPGESITSVLDKIKNMLTEFEYFYNLDGQFVFQKKQSFKETLLTPNAEKIEQKITEGLVLSSTYAYEFIGSELITAFNNNPNLLNLKNDYSVWGERETVSGAKIPIHLRYAIDTIPYSYTHIAVADNDPQVLAYNKKYNVDIKGQTSTRITSDQYDWREVIYQMAVDYYKYNFLDDFELRVAAANPDLYPTGRTGYEQYYIDLYSFWRELYYPHFKTEFQNVKDFQSQLVSEIESLTNEIYNEDGMENVLKNLNNTVDTISKEDVVAISQKYDFKTLASEFVNDSYLCLQMLNDLIYRVRNDISSKQYKLETVTNSIDNFEILEQDYFLDPTDAKVNWNRKVFESPELLNFWFDFLDTSGELQQFNVKTIGSRPKSINDTKIKSIYFREVPQVIYKDPSEKFEEDVGDGYKYIQVQNIDSMFSCSSQNKSAKDRLDELIYQHGYCIESASITSIPIYYLEPNVRIYIYDEKTGLDGDYIISKLTMPLSYNGTMSITATKAAENIL